MSFELNIEKTVQDLIQFKGEADERITQNETNIKTLNKRVTDHDEEIRIIKERISHNEGNTKDLLKISGYHSESLVKYGIAKSVEDELRRIENKTINTSSAKEVQEPAKTTSEVVQNIVDTTKVNEGEGIEIVVVEQEEVHILTKAEFIKNKMVDNEYIVPNGKTVEHRFLHKIVNPALSNLLEVKSIKAEYMEELALEKQTDKFYEKASKKLISILHEIKPSFETYIERKYEEYKNSAEQELSRESSNIIDDSKE